MARRKAESARNPLARIARTPDQAERLLQAGLGSAFAIARSSVEQLLSIDPELSAADAQALHQRASALINHTICSQHFERVIHHSRQFTRCGFQRANRSA